MFFWLPQINHPTSLPTFGPSITHVLYISIPLPPPLPSFTVSVALIGWTLHYSFHSSMPLWSSLRESELCGARWPSGSGSCRIILMRVTADCYAVDHVHLGNCSDCPTAATNTEEMKAFECDLGLQALKHSDRLEENNVMSNSTGNLGIIIN